MARWDAELSALLAKRGRALKGYAFTLCGDHDQAEDLVQDALVKTFSKPRRIRAQDPSVILLPLDGSDAAEAALGTEAYVRRAILTIFLDQCRRRTRWNDRQHLLAADPATRGPESRTAAVVDVASALDRLRPQERAVIVLRHYEDLTIPAIARAMNLAEGTVKKYLASATAELRDVLSDHRVRLAPAPPTTPEHRMEAVI